MKASDLLLRCLENEGVEYMFGVPGEENADVMMSLLDSSIRFIVCRHEQAAAFMADVYGRLTGRAAVCLGTLGPGATNLLTGVGDANMDRAPCIVLTGQAATTRIHKESHQAMDLVKLFEPCVKWGTSVVHPDSIPEIVRKAFRVATTDKYGACHIDLPEDVARMPTLSLPIPVREVPRSAPRAEAVADAARQIREAEFPVILSGNGTLRNRSSEQLRAFARQNGIPVLNTFMGKGAFPPSDPLCLFTIGLGSRDWTAACVERSDRDIVLSDVGAHKMWIARYLQTEEPNTIHISNGFCSMGFALPGALGAKLVHADRRVLAICGDGGFLMNVQDLETAVREKLNVVVMVWVDGEYGLIKWKQTAGHGRHSHISFTNPDFMKLADAFGMAGFAVAGAEDLPGVLEQAFAAGRPALVTVPIDYSENMKLTARLNEIPTDVVCESLCNVDLFAGLPRLYRDAIAAQMEQRTVAAGTTLFREGQPGSELFVIHEGAVVVERDGKELARLGPGEAVGEMAALSAQPRSASVRVTEDLTASVLGGPEFRSLVASQPQLGLTLSTLLAERLSQAAL